MARDMVLGLEAVLADGTVVSSMNRMIKNNAGYDLKQLFIGSEGSLGVVTRAILRLREKPRSTGDAVRRGGRLREARQIPEVDGRVARRHAVGVRSDVEQLLHAGHDRAGEEPAAAVADVSVLRAGRGDGRRSGEGPRADRDGAGPGLRRRVDRRCGDRAVRSAAPADLGDARRRRANDAATDRRSCSTSACASRRWRRTSTK